MTTKKIEWISDNNGNKCSVEYFGSREAAARALKSLINCRDCTNCSDCSGCLGYLGCSRCSGCSDLVGAKPIEGEVKKLEIPVIKNIHTKILEAVSKQGAASGDGGAGKNSRNK